jgi:thioredoxin-like negative regulator of GroEL
VEASRIPQERPTENRRSRRLHKPILLFFTKRTSGPARRMESLIAHVARKERSRLTVVSVDADENTDLVERLSVDQIPTLVVVKDRSAVGRLEGRATGGQIDSLINETLAQT